jgi:chromosomal replication initiator protein
MPYDSAGLWARCLHSIQQKIQPQSFQTWFGPTNSLELCPEKAVIEVPTSFFADWLEEHYSWLIRATVEEETTWKPKLEFVVQSELEGPSEFINNETIKETPSPVDQVAEPVSNVSKNASTLVFPLNPKYRFEQFVVGDSNEFSFTAAKAVAESPGQTAFNPLVIYGGVGLGKTHLLQAIGELAHRKGTAEKIVYVTAEKFFSDYLHAIQKQDTAEYIQIYRNADLLLIDDIQFYVKTEGCQRELIHTFNTLYQNQKQIVLSSDRPPSTLKGFEDRLISRFQWGLVTDIEAPNLETRIAILNCKAEVKGVLLPAEVSRFLAEQVVSNVRELEGALVRLLTMKSHLGLNIDIDLARRALAGMGRQSAPRLPLNIDTVKKVTSDFFDIPIPLLIGATRKQEIASARHVGMYLCKSLIGAPLKTIGDEFGNRDHTTVIHACKTVEKKLSMDPEFGTLVTDLQNRIKSTVPA